MGPWGTFDTAGNMREWCLNDDGTGKRYLLGGGWNDQPFRFSDKVTESPFDRASVNGIRLVKYPGDEPNLAQASRPVAGSFRDFAREKPAGEAVVSGWRDLFEYDRTPLNAKIESTDSSSADWIKERVSIDAAYGNERQPLNVYLPRNHPPPHQVTVLFPGSNALFEPTLNDYYPQILSFLVTGGRALVIPVYKSTWERRDGYVNNNPDSSIAYRDHVVFWAKDFRRAVDYVASRPDLDAARVALLGISWGARMGPLVIAVEPRVRAGILYVGGLSMATQRPEADPFHYLPQVKVPVLMINGEQDQVFPVATSQKPLFEQLGSPPGQKRHSIYQGGHFVPRTQFISESLKWLDQYLGPVGR
jgi:predicted esterase